jgi:hypothetical protein
MLRYDLDRLGWKDFEHLIKTLLKAKFGAGIEVSSSVHDGGREAYFRDKLPYPDSSRLSPGPFLFQCKFVEGGNAARAKGAQQFDAHIQSEMASICNRRKGRAHFKWLLDPKHYVLFTNVDLNALAIRKARNALASILPDTSIYVHNGSDICAWIDSVSDITVRFPQLFSLADFTGLLRNEVRRESATRSEIAINLARQISTAFVATKPYHKAAAILRRHHFVVLEGPPEMGKTSIARMLALAHYRDGWDAIECTQPSEVVQWLDRKIGASQVFLADDCFGSTDYRPDRVGQWQDHLSYIMNRLDASHLLIMTCRAHLWARAKPHLIRGGQPHHFPEVGEVVVNAADLPDGDKARILYRHAKQANLSPMVKAAVREIAPSIVTNPHFTPERVRLLVHEIANQET